MKRILLVTLVVLMLLISSISFVFATTYPKDTPLTEFDGKEMAVQTAVLYEEMLKDRCPNAHWNYFILPNDMIPALTSGKVEGYLIEEVSFYVQKANHPELETLDEPAGIAEYAIAVGNNEKRDMVLADLNEFIDTCKADGTSEAMYDYWIRNFDPDTSTCNQTNGSGEKGKLVVAIEGGYEPFSFESYGEPSGFDVDFMYRFARAYGYEVEFKQVPFESIVPGIGTGKFDCGMNIVVSEERTEGAELTKPYYECPINVVVLGDDKSEMTFFGKLKNSFYKTFIKEDRWKEFLKGTGTTLYITVCSIIFGTILGFLVFMACRHGNKVANKITDFFLWLIQGLPTVVLLMILYYIVFGSSSLSGAWVSIIGFTLIFACSMFDMLTVGYNAIPRGQFEASTALGYSERQSFFKIILPQAAVHFLPIYRNEIVTLIKETAIVGYIAVLDLTKISDLVRSRTYDAFFPLIATAIIYFIVAWAMTSIVKRVEVNINPRRRPDEKILKGIQEWE